MNMGRAKSAPLILAAVLTALLALSAGCMPFAPEPRQAAPVAMPDKFEFYSPGEPGPDKWWRALGSDELDGLVDTALQNNFDIVSAWARLNKAKAVAAQAGAELYPTLDLDSGAGQGSKYTQSSPGSDGSMSETKAYNLGLAASYEVDLWGRLRSVREAELASAGAAREDVESAAMTVAASVAETWIDIVSTKRQIAIVKQQVQINTTLLDLQIMRFHNGQAGALDVSQQRETLAASKADLPVLERDLATLTNQLAFLLGRASSRGLNLSQDTLPELAPLPPSGLPADLLANRPDVRAAGLRLHSADWTISAARADRLPSISISAEAAFSSGALDVLFNNWLANLAANLTGPLFDGGRRAAVVDEARADADEKLAAYASTVAAAIFEVEDSLVGEQKERDYIERLSDQLQASRLSQIDARLQYVNGSSDYLSYLVAWTSVQALELKLVSEQANLIKYRVGLHRAVGGDWTRQLNQPERAGKDGSGGRTTEAKL